MDEISTERRHRIRVALAAWAYEKYDKPIMDDAEFDALSLEINPQMKTGHEVLDKFFAKEFNSSTGSWVHRHPELNKLDDLLKRVYRID